MDPRGLGDHLTHGCLIRWSVHRLATSGLQSSPCFNSCTISPSQFSFKLKMSKQIRTDTPNPQITPSKISYIHRDKNRCQHFLWPSDKDREKIQVLVLPSRLCILSNEIQEEWGSSSSVRRNCCSFALISARVRHAPRTPTDLAPPWPYESPSGVRWKKKCLNAFGHLYG